jgi:hypothetical protein
VTRRPSCFPSDTAAFDLPVVLLDDSGSNGAPLSILLILVALVVVEVGSDLYTCRAPMQLLRFWSLLLLPSVAVVVEAVVGRRPDRASL